MDNTKIKLIKLLISDVTDGDIIMLATQRYLRQVEGSERIPKVYNALETLIYGEVTNKSLLRTVNDEGDTWAMVFQKGNVAYT